MIRRFSLLFLLACSVVSLVGTAMVSSAYAQGSIQTRIENGLDGAAAGYGDVQTDPKVIVARLVNVALGIFGSILFIYMIWAGVLWMTAGGDSKKVDKARDMIKNAIIGIAIITFAYTIATYVLTQIAGAVAK